jgi:glycolate oxidase iron-sulfur subunit
VPDVAAGRFAALDPCVHCGFCLSSCPTYLATGDESDSPRGRIVLMRGLERGEIAASDRALREHLNACLGCRGCEPACPSGVGYGRGLEAAREILWASGGILPLARLALWLFRSPARWRAVFGASRVARDLGLARRLAGAGRLGFSLGMVAATADRDGARPPRPAAGGSPAKAPSPDRPPVALFRGCVMDALFGHVHRATQRTLEANGYRVIAAPGQVCCGALHDHAGDRRGAAALAARNVRALGQVPGLIAVNSAGCGALLKDYGHLLGTPEAAAVAARVRDVSELLAERGPRQGGSLDLEVAYDAPCHLQHAQRVHAQPLAVLNAIPGLRVQLLPGFDRCCGSAGIYSLLQPGLSREILREKLESIAAARPQPRVIATGNPGCLMQLGAGCLAAGLPIEVRHPVELLDWSYQAAGLY